MVKVSKAGNEPNVRYRVLSIPALNNVSYARDRMIFLPIDANRESDIAAAVHIDSGFHADQPSTKGRRIVQGRCRSSPLGST